MNNFDVEDVFSALRDDVNEFLGTVAKDTVESKNYAFLAIIAEIGSRTNVFLDELQGSLTTSTANYSLLEPAIIDAEEVETIPETEVAEVVSKKTTWKISRPKRTFSIPNDETRNWIFNYLGKRGGTSLKEDLLKDFYKEFSSRFSADEIVRRGKNYPWRAQIFHRVSEMRETTVDDANNQVESLMVPNAGSQKDYYHLSKYGLDLYNANQRKVEKHAKQMEMEMEG